MVRQEAINYGTNGGSTWVAPFLSNGWCNFHCSLLKMATLHLRVGCTCCCPLNGNIPTITSFDIYMGNCSLASSAQACILQLFQAYHSESIFSQVYMYLLHLSITRITKAHPCSHQRITSTRWSPTSHLKSVNACL